MVKVLEIIGALVLFGGSFALITLFVVLVNFYFDPKELKVKIEKVKKSDDEKFKYIIILENGVKFYSDYEYIPGQFFDYKYEK